MALNLFCTLCLAHTKKNRIVKILFTFSFNTHTKCNIVYNSIPTIKKILQLYIIIQLHNYKKIRKQAETISWKLTSELNIYKFINNKQTHNLEPKHKKSINPKTIHGNLLCLVLFLILGLLLLQPIKMAPPHRLLVHPEALMRRSLIISKDQNSSEAELMQNAQTRPLPAGARSELLGCRSSALVG